MKTLQRTLTDTIRELSLKYCPNSTEKEMDNYLHYQFAVIKTPIRHPKWKIKLLGPLYGHPEAKEIIQQAGDACIALHRDFIQAKVLETVHKLESQKISVKTILLPGKWLEFLPKDFSACSVLESEFPAVLSDSSLGRWAGISLDESQVA